MARNHGEQPSRERRQVLLDSVELESLLGQTQLLLLRVGDSMVRGAGGTRMYVCVCMYACVSVCFCVHMHV